METTVKALTKLLSENEIEACLEKLEDIFALAESELVNDVILIRARNKKLHSDKRKGVISYENETLRHNELVHSTLSLIEEIKSAPKTFNKLDTIEDTIQNDTIEKRNIKLPITLKDALVRRLSYVKQKKLALKGLWIDDNPYNQPYAKEILADIGITFDIALNSEQAWYQIQNNEYELIVSDIHRGVNPTAGIDFHQTLIEHHFYIPTVFFIAKMNPALGTPAYSFGITNTIADLLHYVMDIVERKY